jgi:hypothetical protein
MSGNTDETNMNNLDTLRIDIDESEEELTSLNESDIKDLKLRKTNLKDLKTIQKMYFVYENEALSIDETLSRVLEFYRKFIPYK